jgi:hypothetical protein
VLENKVLRRIFGLKRDKVTGGWRKLRNKVLSSIIITRRMIRSRRMRRAEHVAG